MAQDCFTCSWCDEVTDEEEMHRILSPYRVSDCKLCAACFEEATPFLGVQAWLGVYEPVATPDFLKELKRRLIHRKNEIDQEVRWIDSALESSDSESASDSDDGSMAYMRRDTEMASAPDKLKADGTCGVCGRDVDYPHSDHVKWICSNAVCGNWASNSDDDDESE